MKKDIVMLSIDSSTKKTGVAIWKNAILSDYLLLDFSGTTKMTERFPVMLREVLSLLKRLHPDIIYIEDEVVVRNMDTCRFLFRLQGAIEGYCVQNGCEFNTVRPTVWRKAVGIEQGKKKRNELKDESIRVVRESYNINVEDDVADAICIGMYALQLFGIKTV